MRFIQQEIVRLNQTNVPTRVLFVSFTCERPVSTTLLPSHAGRPLKNSNQTIFFEHDILVSALKNSVLLDCARKAPLELRIILIIQSGIVKIDSVGLVVRGGDCCLLNSGLPHLLVSQTDELNAILVGYDLRFLRRFYKPSALQFLKASLVHEGSLHLNEDQLFKLMHLADNLQKLTRQEKQNTLGCASLLMLVINSVSRLLSNQESGYLFVSPLFERFRVFVQKHGASKATVSEYAQLLQISSGHLNRIVKASAGVGPKQFISERRIDLAKNLLTTTNLGLDSIASNLNFSDLPHLIREFKKVTGFTPGEYRRNFRKTKQIVG